MDEQNQDESSKKSPAESAVTEPVRSRWTPKPEQILILESIFNSGMVNPPKEETVRIRKLLEKFGAVGDANVFYWFQNRRSRSRRRQRQLQAGLAADTRSAATSQVAGVGYSVPHDQATSSSSSGASPHSYYSSPGGLFPSSSNYAPSSSSSSPSSSSSYGFVADERVDDIFSSFSASMGFTKGNFEGSSDPSLLQYQPGTITVFINGALTEVPRAAFNLRAMFGQNVMLVHSSGEFVPVNELGVLIHSLQMGESYFLVSSST